MSGDLFANGLQIPDITDAAAVPKSADYPGFLRTYYRNGVLYAVNSDGVETTVSKNAKQTFLNLDGGSSSTTFQNYLVRFDFGANGSTINPQGIE